MHAQLIRRLSKESIDWLYAWVRAQPLADTTKSSYVNGRLEAWYRRGSNLQNIPCGRAEVYAAPEPHEKLIRFGDAHLPDWHSLLVCGGQTTITQHRDHGHFEAEAVMINLGVAVFSEHTGDTVESLRLQDGDVVRLNIKVMHSARQLSAERYNFCFRRIRPQFLHKHTPQPTLLDL